MYGAGSLVMHAGESESVSRTVCDVTVLGCPSSNSSSRTPATRERDRISPLSLSLSLSTHIIDVFLSTVITATATTAKQQRRPIAVILRLSPPSASFETSPFSFLLSFSRGPSSVYLFSYSSVAVAVVLLYSVDIFLCLQIDSLLAYLHMLLVSSIVRLCSFSRLGTFPSPVERIA
jgi:hypothetical protein